MKPYIGITDFTAYEQVEEMSGVFDFHRQNGSKRILHVGVMMSYKTLHGIPSRWTEAFPPKEKIADIFASEKVYNCLHYADFDNDPHIGYSISEAISHGGIGINAIQLDMVWPDPGQVAHGVHTSRKQIEVILQIGKSALRRANESPREVVEHLGDYEGIIHRVLLDKSMGKGIGLDATALLPFVRAIRTKYPAVGIVIAGGLGPKTIRLIEPFVKEFPDISIDAQGQLRPSGDALDPIDWNLARSYLVDAFRFLK